MPKQTYTISGKVISSTTEQGIDGLTIKAYDKVIGDKILLKTASTNYGGVFQMKYEQSQLEAGKEQADIVLEVYEPQNATPIFTSEVYIEAEPELQVELAVDYSTAPKKTEFEQIESKLKVQLKTSSKTRLQTQLTHAVSVGDLPYVAKKMKEEPAAVKAFQQATSLSKTTKLSPQIHYALLRKQLPAGLKAYATLDQERVKKALQSAVAENLIAVSQQEIAEIADDLQNQAIDEVYDDQHELVQLVKMSAYKGNRLTKNQQKEFVRHYVKNKKGMGALWQSLPRETFNKQEALDQLQFTFKLRDLTQNQLPVIEGVQKKGFTSVRQLVGFEWYRYINSNKVEQWIEAHVEGEDLSEKKRNYRKQLERKVEREFPTAIFAHELAKSGNGYPQQEALLSFFEQHPDFDFTKTNILHFLNQQEDGLAIVDEADKPELERALKSTQRLFNLTPPTDKFEAIATLKQMNLDNAFAIKEMSRHTFVNRYLKQHSAGTDPETKQQANQIFNRSSRTATAMLMAFTKFGRPFNEPGLKVLPGLTPKSADGGSVMTLSSGSKGEEATWENLFGSLDTMSCAHGQSVYSPAAYLYDLLIFLEYADSTMNGGTTALEVLKSRRPDIPYILLNEKNTFTELPYIDLVNELLEGMVSPNGVDCFQTSLSKEELSAYPEHTNVKAIEKLRSAIEFPWLINLPFDLDSAEVEDYLNQLGVPRYQLVEVFKNEQQRTELNIAAAYIGFSNAELSILLQDFPQNSESGRVLDLLSQFQLEYEELLQLLSSLYVNPGEGKDEVSDLENIIITLTKGFGRLFRFRRLLKKLNWSTIELDRVIHLFGGEINEALITNLAYLLRIQEKYNVPTPTLMTWWADMDTEDYEEDSSLFTKLFMTSFREEANDLKDAFTAVKNGEALPNILEEDGKGNYRYLPLIQSALKIKLEDLLLVFKTDKETFQLQPAGRFVKHPSILFNLSNLTYLYAVVSFCKVLGLELSEYYTFKKFIGTEEGDLIQPLKYPGDGIQSPENTFRFITELEIIRNAGFSIAELDYLLNNEASPNLAICPDEASVNLFLYELQQALGEININSEQQEVENIDFLRDALSLYPVYQRPFGKPGSFESREKALGAIKDIVLNKSSDELDYEDQEDRIEENASIFPDPLSIDKLVNRGLLFELGERRDYVFNKLETDQFQPHVPRRLESELKKIFGEDHANYSICLEIIENRPQKITVTYQEEFIQKWPQVFGKGDEAQDAINKLVDRGFEKDIDKRIEFVISGLSALSSIRAYELLTAKTLLATVFGNDDELINQILSVILGTELLDEEARAELIQTQFYQFMNREEAKIKFAGSDTTPEQAHQHLLETIAAIPRSRVVIKSFSEHFALPPAVIASILTKYFDQSIGLSVFLNEDFIVNNQSPLQASADDNKSQIESYLLLNKIAVFINRLGIKEGDVDFVFENGRSLNWLDLTLLPVVDKKATTVGTGFTLIGKPNWARAKNFIEFFHFLQAIPAYHAGEFSLSTYMGGETDLSQYLADSLGWNAEGVTFLAEKFGFNVEEVGPNRDQILLQLYHAFQIIHRIGGNAQQVWSLAQPEIGYLESETVRNLVKAKYDEKSWGAIAEQIQTGIREKKRDALLTYVLWKESDRFRDVEDIYAHLLIDPQVNACFKTSRLKQAIASVQLFVQRILMNLESDKDNQLTFHPEIAEEWKWRKNYRVWEANRKVFLYPENWIEPELRDDKSPFFKELEDELLQDELNKETTERVYLNYLHKLKEVSHLEICAETYDDERRELHVFGRTKAQPHVYYYRKWDEDSEVWGAWEKVDLDIEGEHLLPVMHNGRLILIWLILKNETAKDIKLTKDSGGALEENLEFFSVKIAWSPYQKHNWKSKKISSITLSPKDGLESISSLDHVLDAIYNNSSSFLKKEKYAFTNKRTSVEKCLTKNNSSLTLIIELKGLTTGKEVKFPCEFDLIFPYLEFNESLEDFVEKIESEYKWKITSQLIKDNLLVLRNLEYPSGIIPFNELDTESYGIHYKLQELSLEIMIDDNEDEKYKIPTGLEYFPEHILHNKSNCEKGLLIRHDNPKYLILCENPDLCRLHFLRNTYPFQNSIKIRCKEGAYYYRRFNGEDDTVYFESEDWIDISKESDDGTYLLKVLQNPEPNWLKLHFDVFDNNSNSNIEIQGKLNVSDYSPGGFYNSTLLSDSNGGRIVGDLEYGNYFAQAPFFFLDINNTFFVRRLIINTNSFYDNCINIRKQKYAFSTFYHPDINKIIKSIKLNGINDSLSVGHGIILNQISDYYSSSTSKNISKWFKEKYLPDTAFSIWFHSVKLNEYDKSSKVVIHVSIDYTDGYIVKDLTSRIIDDNDVINLYGIAFLFYEKITISFSYNNQDKKIFYEIKYSDLKLGFNKTRDEFSFIFELFSPMGKVDGKFPSKKIDFSIQGAYGQYNWELFFHIPFLIACRYSQDQKFEEAQKWFQYIFNPTQVEEVDSDHPFRHFWMVKPFYEAYEKGDVTALFEAGTDNELEKQLCLIEEDPFNPHLIARYRIVAYMKSVVMKYLDNLIAWGDQLFRRDTMESINEATQLYLLAYGILERKPIPFEIAEKNDQPGTALLLELEDVLSKRLGSNVGCSEQNSSTTPIISFTNHFCFPPNQKLSDYWKTINDRLFKIRNCMNMEGRIRQLALFQPPIDPALLVRARAAGIDISSVLNNLAMPMTHYRFQFMLQKSLELCNEVKSLGGSLLSALEKKDAETLALIRSRQEKQLLKAVKDIKRKSVEEAETNLEGLENAQEITKERYDYYRNLKKVSSNEKVQLRRLENARTLQTVGQVYDLLANFSFLIPDTTGTATGPEVKHGGTHIGNAFKAYSSFYSFLSSIESYYANKASIKAGQERRWDEWKLQERTTQIEIDQIEKQKIASAIRIDIANKDLENHEQQIENAEEIAAYYKEKFTNKQLYSWMVSQISGLYFQSYQLAYDIAKRAERAYQHELGLAAGSSSFIEFGYWDSLKKGLLSGERLHLDLRRMEAAYLEQNKREYELTKHISLALLNPEALLQLRETNTCFFDIPEVLFDLDHPGQYMRRIKSVSMTIPCVTGPYTSVNAKLSLISNRIRREPRLDEELQSSFIGLQSIATSSAQSDSGLFELNFRDERYLPFEGAGAISSWRLELPTEFHQFDYNTISDVIIHMNYTARDGGDTFKDIVNTSIQKAINNWVEVNKQTGLLRLFNLKDEFPREWNDLTTETDHTCGLILERKHFPFFTKGKKIILNSIQLYFEPLNPNFTIPEGLVPNPTKLPDLGELKGISFEPNNCGLEPGISSEKNTCTIPLTANSAFTEEQVKRGFMLVTYNVETV